MASVAQLTIQIGKLSSRVLQMPPDAASPQEAVHAVQRYLERRRPALAGGVRVAPTAGAVVLSAEGEAPEEMLREAREMLCADYGLPPDVEIEVDPAEFAIDASAVEEHELPEREILRSEVRYFPYPECEWFEISSGELLLTDRKVVYEPELVVSASPEGPLYSAHVIALGEVLRAYRGEWWDVPCLMIETPKLTYRFGWPAVRGEPGTIFDVDEWLGYLRSLLAESE